MKVKLMSLIDCQMTSDEKITRLEREVTRLAQENTKLNTDMQILRDEHTEVLHQLFNLERKPRRETHESE